MVFEAIFLKNVVAGATAADVLQALSFYNQDPAFVDRLRQHLLNHEDVPNKIKKALMADMEAQYLSSVS